MGVTSAVILFWKAEKQRKRADCTVQDEQHQNVEDNFPSSYTVENSNIHAFVFFTMTLQSKKFTGVWFLKMERNGKMEKWIVVMDGSLGGSFT